MARDYSDRITWVVVADGEKALILQNMDTDARPDLRIISSSEIDNPSNRDQSAARPGRMNDGRAGSARKSAFEETDFHRLAKLHFAKDLSARLNRAALAGAFDRLVVIAPPASLGELRSHYHPELQTRLTAEIDKDLTRHPVEGIERQVASALAEH